MSQIKIEEKKSVTYACSNDSAKDNFNSSAERLQQPSPHLV